MLQGFLASPQTPKPDPDPELLLLTLQGFLESPQTPKPPSFCCSCFREFWKALKPLSLIPSFCCSGFRDFLNALKPLSPKPGPELLLLMLQGFLEPPESPSQNNPNQGTGTDFRSRHWNPHRPYTLKPVTSSPKHLSKPEETHPRSLQLQGAETHEPELSHRIGFRLFGLILAVRLSCDLFRASASFKIQGDGLVICH